MQLSAFAATLSGDLAALGRLGDEATATAAERLAAAMAPQLSARLLELMSQLAAELDATVPSGRVEVRVVGGDAELVLVPGEPAETQPASSPEGDADARITLRLPSQLKARAEAAAAAEGVSLNTYIVRVLGQQSGRQVSTGRRRLSGYGRS